MKEKVKMNNLKAKTSHLKIKEIRQHVGLEYIAAKKFPDLPEKEAVDGTIELWKNFRGVMKEFFVLRGNENDYKGKYLEGYYKNPRWWAGLYDGNKIDSREIAQELITQLYELSKVTLPKLDVVESLHFTNVDEYDISYREETGYRAWAWLDEKDVRGKDCRVSFLKKVRSEWEEKNND